MDKNNNFKDNLKVSIKNIEKSVFDLSNYYAEATNEFNTEYLKNITAAIYLEYKRMFPNLDIFIPFRQKSTRSFQKNMEKELNKHEIENFPSSYIEDSNKDIAAIKVVLYSIPESLEFLDYTDKANASIVALQRQKIKNLAFVNEIIEWISGDTDTPKDEEHLYKYYIEILDRLQKSSYEECTDEIEIPYSNRYKGAVHRYNSLKKNGTFHQFASEEQIGELKRLIGCLNRRMDDKLENEILNVTLPKVLQSNLIKDVLHVNAKIDSSPSKDNGWLIKPNGYIAFYHQLQTDSGLKIEVQAQSRKGYEDDKTGPRFHNGLPGKKINVNSFFELSNKDDEKPIEYYIDLLDNSPAEILNKNYNKKSVTKHDGLVLEALDHIKIKDTLSFKNGDSLIELPTDEYLLSLVNYASPEFYVCRSAHNVTRNAASIERKQSIEAFSDVLRKKEGISCLSQLLIDRLENIVQNDSITTQLSEREILQFAEKNKYKINSNISKNNKSER